MKLTLKISLITICMLFSAGVFAQLPLTYGVKGGINLSDISNFYDNPKVGFNIGVTVDYKLTDKYYILSGLEFTTKGAKGSLDDEGSSQVSGKGKGTQSPMYLQIPIHAGYKMEIAPDTRLVFRAGPYLAYGIAGKSKGDYTITDSEGVVHDYNMDQDFFEKANRFEFGIGGAAGVEFGKILVELGADMGMTRVWDNTNLSNRVAHLNVGYKF